MAETITIEEAQARLRELIQHLTPGEELIITDNGQFVARMVGHQAGDTESLRPPPGLGKGMITFIAPDFDAPLEDMWEYME